MLKYTYISSSIFACSWGGQLVQLPGSENVNPARIRTAVMFLANDICSWRVAEVPVPVLKYNPGSFLSSSNRTICHVYRRDTCTENCAISTDESVETLMFQSLGLHTAS